MPSNSKDHEIFTFIEVKTSRYSNKYNFCILVTERQVTTKHGDNRDFLKTNPPGSDLC